MRVQEIIRIHDVTRQTPRRSLVILAFSLPAVLFGPIAGVMADRFNRKHVMFATNILRAVAMLLFLGIRPEWHVQTILAATYAVTFIFGVAGQFFAPAQGAMIPALVPRENLVLGERAVQPDLHGLSALGIRDSGAVAGQGHRRRFCICPDPGHIRRLRV